MLPIPTSFETLFLSFRDLFSSPSLQNFLTLAVGWILCSGPHTISGVLRALWPFGRHKHFSVFYRFFSRASWSVSLLGQAVFRMSLTWLPGKEVLVIVDDTLCRKSGPHIWGAGMHHDPLRSTYGRFTDQGRKVSFAFGLRFVVLFVYVPLPWDLTRGVALPVLFRLYRPRKRCPEAQYAKATQLASQMIETVSQWLPDGYTLRVTGDLEYACRTVVRGLCPKVHFVGPVHPHAALYDLPDKTARGLGRPRRKGARLASPKQWAQDRTMRWREQTLHVYGRQVRVRIKARVCLWYRVAGTRPVLVVLVRDPSGHYQDRAYFSTDLSLAPEQVAEIFSLRWTAEVAFRASKQSMGLEDPQNGWARRAKRFRRRPKKRPGPQAHATRGCLAAARTTPFILLVYTLVHLWYFEHGKISREVRLARLFAPWYRHKCRVSFADMLQAARRELWRGMISVHTGSGPLSQKVLRTFEKLGLVA